MTALTEAWTSLKTAPHGRYARDVAAELGVSEAELVAAGIATGDVTRLKAEWKDLLDALPALGEVMVLTRNDSAVHEKIGVFDNIKVMGAMGLVLNREIDLRLFLSHWGEVFAVRRETAQGPRHSLQIFDTAGDAALKIYLRPTSALSVYDQIVERFAHPDNSPTLAVTPLPAAEPDRPDAEVDAQDLRAAWAGLKDVHDFFGMLKDRSVGRQQALRLVGEEFAEEVTPSALRTVVETAAERDISIMVFVGNYGCVQIHTGPVKTLKTMGTWFNILDPTFNLHLREDAIASAWVVRKPHKDEGNPDGLVTSLELYDARGRNFAILYGERGEGNAERADWREVLAALPRAARPGMAAE